MLGERIDGLSGPYHGTAPYVESCADCFAQCGRAFYRAPSESPHGRTLCEWCALAWSEAREPGERCSACRGHGATWNGSADTARDCAPCNGTGRVRPLREEG